MDTKSQARKHLSEIAKRLGQQHREKLLELKANATELERDDWLWHSLLGSFATMGNSRGHDGLIKNQTNYRRVSYEALSTLAKGARGRTIRQTLRDAGVRMPNKKAKWLDKNFERIARMGGPLTAKRQLLERPGRKAKLAFLDSFEGIGPKYARNMLMDVYHIDFRDSIAIDLRIASISESWNLPPMSYEEAEQFYLSVARDAQLEGWELDRLMYSFRDDFLKASKSSRANVCSA